MVTNILHLKVPQSKVKTLEVPISPDKLHDSDKSVESYQMEAIVLKMSSRVVDVLLITSKVNVVKVEHDKQVKQPKQVSQKVDELMVIDGGDGIDGMVSGDNSINIMEGIDPLN